MKFITPFLKAFTARLNNKIHLLIVLAYFLLFQFFPAKAQSGDNYFFALLDSLEPTPLVDWAKFNEADLKPCKSYIKSNYPKINVLTAAGIEHPTDEAINAWLNHLCKNKRTAAAFTAFSKSYFQISETALKEAGLPLIYKYLPAVISAGNTKASMLGGAGIWNLSFPRAVSGGLKVSPDYDERLDPVKSTSAAVKAIKKIHVEEAGNIKITLLRYLYGRNYASGGFFKNAYTPDSFLKAYAAVVYIFETNALGPLTEATVNLPPTVSYTTEKPIIIKLSDKSIPFNAKAILYLNPVFSSGTIPTGTALIIPEQDFVSFAEWAKGGDIKAQTEETEKVLHKVKSGETLNLIASKYRVSVNELMLWNNLKSTIIREGQTLIMFKKSSLK
jgi:membrane-bound lytic murein transglycosylase D